MKNALMLTALLCIVACNQQKDSFIDLRDWQKYRAVTIGNQTWMAQNLNFATKHSLCYQNYAGNCKMFGRLYGWDDAMAACPKGWHLPTRDEWDTLIQYAGGSCVAGKKLKSKRMSIGDGINRGGWAKNEVYGTDNTDDYGFSALAGGWLWGGTYKASGWYGEWWSATKYSDTSAHRPLWCITEHAGIDSHIWFRGYAGGESSAYTIKMYFDDDTAEEYYRGWNRNDGMSVRCVKG
ncbi:MAG: hypothetical protein LBH93_08070 [Chitinispirillales bacterium]|jgi:uncharacterized protein (TIGR02145 family)|nr:hypothetical protein [Chitinispirillales bacterium]